MLDSNNGGVSSVPLATMGRLVLIAVGLLLASCQHRVVPLTSSMENWKPPAAGMTSDYRADQLGRQFHERSNLDRAMFFTLCEAGYRRDPQMAYFVKVYGGALGYLPNLARRYYEYRMGDQAQLAWLLAEFDRRGLGRDSAILFIFAYLDEWEETIIRFKRQQALADGAAGEVLSEAIALRKRLYGNERFDRAGAALPLEP